MRLRLQDRDAEASNKVPEGENFIINTNIQNFSKLILKIY